MHFIVFDTEDTSKELQEDFHAKLKATGRTWKQTTNRWGFKKRVTQIAAMSTRGESYYSKGDVLGFFKWCKSQRVKFIYAHNVQYDLGNLFGDDLDFLNPVLIGPRLIRCPVGQFVFRDSLNMFPMSVKVLGSKMGLQKLKFNASDKEYVMRDVKIVFTALTGLLTFAGEYGVESLPSTVGGLAVKVWKAMGGENWFCDSDFVKNSFFGGRVEIWRTQYDDCSLTDINSLYPFVMRNLFPTESSQLKDIDCLGIAHVTIKIPETEIAPLPFRTKTGAVYYPIGKLQGVWTTPELQNAVNHGCKITKIHSVYGSKKGEYYYRDFTDEFYKRRKATDNAREDEFCKRLMNNLYGQLATKGEITRTVDNSHLSAYYPCFGSKALMPCKIPIPAHTNYLHGSLVTGYGRVELYKWLDRIGADKLVYCDTDGTILKGKAGFELGKQLGQMKLVEEGVSAKIIGPKCYLFGASAKAKGVPSRLAREFLKAGRVDYAQPFKIREAVSGFDSGNEKKLSVWRMVEKNRITEYDRKRKLPDKYLPLYVDAAAEIR